MIIYKKMKSSAIILLVISGDYTYIKIDFKRLA